MSLKYMSLTVLTLTAFTSFNSTQAMIMEQNPQEYTQEEILALEQEKQVDNSIVSAVLDAAEPFIKEKQEQTKNLKNTLCYVTSSGLSVATIVATMDTLDIPFNPVCSDPKHLIGPCFDNANVITVTQAGFLTAILFQLNNKLSNLFYKALSYAFSNKSKQE